MNDVEGMQSDCKRAHTKLTSVSNCHSPSGATRICSPWRFDISVEQPGRRLIQITSCIGRLPGALRVEQQSPK